MSEPQVKVALGQDMLPIVEAVAARHAEVLRHMREVTNAAIDLRALLQRRIGEPAVNGILQALERHHMLDKKKYHGILPTGLWLDIGTAVAEYLMENINEFTDLIKAKEDARGRFPDHGWSIDQQNQQEEKVTRMQMIAKALRLGPVYEAELDQFEVGELEYAKQNAAETVSPGKPLQGAQ